METSTGLLDKILEIHWKFTKNSTAVTQALIGGISPRFVIYPQAGGGDPHGRLRSGNFFPTSSHPFMESSYYPGVKSSQVKYRSIVGLRDRALSLWLWTVPMGVRGLFGIITSTIFES